MTAIYHPGVVLVIPKYDLGHPNNAANVLAWQTAAVGLVSTQLTAVQTAFDTAWSTGWKAIAPSINRYMGSWVIDMSSSTGTQVTNALYTPVVGTAGATSWADNCAALISLHTSLRYRGGHGRIYIPGLSSGGLNADGSTLLPSYMTNLTSLWNNTANAMAALSGAAGGPYVPIVWHKHLTSNPNSIETVQGIVVNHL